MEHQTTIPLIPELDEWEFNDRAAALCAVAEGIIHQECCMNGCAKRNDWKMCGHPIHCEHFKPSNGVPLECTAFEPVDGEGR